VQSDSSKYVTNKESLKKTTAAFTAGPAARPKPVRQLFISTDLMPQIASVVNRINERIRIAIEMPHGAPAKAGHVGICF